MLGITPWDKQEVAETRRKCQVEDVVKWIKEMKK